MIKIKSLCFLAFLLNGAASWFVSAAEDRPNFLWIVSEDNGRFLGCYGDANAATPNLDKLAAKGIRYTRFYANAPVCAVARSSWIFGVPAVTTGTLHMRSKYLVPRDTFTPYPELLREAGYYATNNAKTDYNSNSVDEDSIWDESSNKAHYQNRPTGKPFFAIFNIGQTHESGVFPRNFNQDTAPRVPAEAIQVPPYQVSTDEVIKDWQQYYERLALMDAEVGRRLRELEASGEAANTIVLYCSDHGGVLLRSKRFLHDSGTHVPLIAYFPEKWRHLAPADPGSISDRLTQFIDLPKTWLSLAGAKVPPVMPGRVFLGKDTEPEPESVFLFSGRFDEAPDNSRGVTDGRWRYIRNYESDRLRFQMLTYPIRQDGQRSQWHEFNAGRTNALQSAHYLPQPSEELYDTQADPHEVDNLAAKNPLMVEKMRKRLADHILAARDLGFIPEPMMERINEGGEETIFEFGQSPSNYPIQRIVKLATQASDGDESNLPIFKQALTDENAIVRYWGAVGLRILGDAAPEAALARAAADEEPSVRIVGAVALGKRGQRDRAIALLLAEAKAAEGVIQATWALDGLKLLDAPEALPSDAAELKKLNKGNYSERIIEVLQAGGSTYRLPKESL